MLNLENVHQPPKSRCSRVHILSQAIQVNWCIERDLVIRRDLNKEWMYSVRERDAGQAKSQDVPTPGSGHDVTKARADSRVLVRPRQTSRQTRVRATQSKKGPRAPTSLARVAALLFFDPVGITHLARVVPIPPLRLRRAGSIHRVTRRRMRVVHTHGA